MTTLMIKAKNNKGKAALEQHLQEFKKLKWKDRLVMKSAGYKHWVECKNPLSVCVSMKKSRFSNNAMFMELVIAELHKAMKQNGASKKDYVLEVTP